MIVPETVREIRSRHPMNLDVQHLFRPTDFDDIPEYVDPVRSLQMASLGYWPTGERIGLLEGRIMDRDDAHDVADAMRPYMHFGLPHLQAVIKDRQARATGARTMTFMFGGEQLVAGPFLSPGERRYHAFIGEPLLEAAWLVGGEVYKAIQEA